ncbi:hypothetical protein EDB84DRAFT_1440545 [Lactarius hengduanensis]|nr:hypothetical protein EDB84DRAFT_1440545 [Lactarius hengduanensis]
MLPHRHGRGASSPPRHHRSARANKCENKVSRKRGIPKKMQQNPENEGVVEIEIEAIGEWKGIGDASEGISIILAADKLPPRCLSETIDPTADDDWFLFAPHIFTPPPISPIASILDLVKPVDELPPPSRSIQRSISPTVPATTHNESPDPPLPLTLDLPALASAVQRVDEHSVAAPVKIDNDEILVTSPHVTNGTTRKHKHKTDGEDVTHPGKRIHAQLARRSPFLHHKWTTPVVFSPPFDSSGLFAPIQLHRSSTFLPSPSFPDTIDRTTSVDCTTAIAKLSALPAQPTTATSVLPTALALNPHVCSHSLVLINDARTEPNNGLQINAVYLSSPSPRSLPNLLPSHVASAFLCPLLLVSPRTPFSGLQPLSPDSPSHLSLAVDKISLAALPAIIAPALEDINVATDAVLFTSRPPSPSVIPAFSPARPPISVVADNNLPKRGVKTIENSVLIEKLALTQNNGSTKPPVYRYSPIFLPRACERPCNPDEVTPATPLFDNQAHHHAGETTAVAPHPQPTVPPVTIQNHRHHHLRATTTEFVPRPVFAGPTQINNIWLALRQPTSYLAHAIARIPQNVIGTGQPPQQDSL